MKASTLAEHLEPSAVDFDILKARYDPMLKLVKELIGVVPNCDPLLEIWPIGFRTYNLLVPSCLNLPFLMFGGSAPKALVGLAMYAASRTAACSYCSAHTCTFALRIGARPASLGKDPDPREAAVIAVAEGLARVPCDLSASQCLTLTQYFSPREIDWIVYSIGLMGFLNKFMDAVGVPLEADFVTEVGQPQPSMGRLTDNMGSYFRILRQMPSAIGLEQRWTAGVPNRWPAAGVFLEKHTGYRLPLLGQLRHKRMMRALTTVLRDNLRAANSEVGLTAKCLSALVYATVVQNEALAAAARQLAPDLDATTLAEITQFAAEPAVADVETIQRWFSALSSLPGISESTAAAIILAQAASTSPAQIGEALLTTVTPHLNPTRIVELMVWLSVQQLLHRLGCFYAIGH